MDLSFDLKSISTHRGTLMGLAAIGILMCHAASNGVNLPASIMSILALGQLGVDIFFFLSGLGILFSLSKQSGSVCVWYKKRFLRIIVPYLIIYAPVLLLDCNIEDKEWWYYFYNISTISVWFDSGGCWFIAVLIPLYLLAPYWKKVLDCSQYTVLATFGICIVFYMIGTYLAPHLRDYLNQAMFFFMGMWIARYVGGGKRLPFKRMIFVIALFLFLVILYRYYSFCPLFWILFFPVLFSLCKMLDWIKADWVHRTLGFMGKISLESYLFNVTLIAWINAFSLLPASLYEDRYLFIVVFGTILSAIVNEVSKRLLSLLE